MTIMRDEVKGKYPEFFTGRGTPQVELVCQLPYIIPVTKACRTEILRFILSSRSSHRLPLRGAVSYSTHPPTPLYLVALPVCAIKVLTET